MRAVVDAPVVNQFMELVRREEGDGFKVKAVFFSRSEWARLELELREAGIKAAPGMKLYGITLGIDHG